MARIRSIHPALFTDEAFVTLSPLARVLLLGIWTEADDHGAFDWKPLTLKMRVLPADNADVTALLGELATANVVKQVEIGEKAIGLVRNFCRFQRPKNPSYRITLPTDYWSYVGMNKDGSIPNHQSSPSATPAEPEPDPPAPETRPQRKEEGWNRRRERKKPIQSSTPDVVVVPEKHDDNPKAVDVSVGQESNPLGTTLPADWIPLAEEIATARGYGMGEQEIEAELLTFHAYNAQHGTFSKNWSATWGMWCARWKEREAAKPKQAAPRVEVNSGPTDSNWDWACAQWAKGASFWSHKSLGPAPDQTGCRCPPKFLTKYHIDPATGRVAAPSETET